MDDAFAGLSSALEARYALLGEIGHGGMAVVLLAEDLKHHRRVKLSIPVSLRMWIKFVLLPLMVLINDR